jgi:chromosome segregation ATPase
MDRRRERKELQRELASLEQQIPQLETDLRQASIGLGHELWRIGKERFAAFRATPRLNDIDAAVSQLEAKQSDVDRTFGERNDQYQQWLAGWQEEAARRDAELNAANQAVAESLAELAKAKEEVIAALASRAESLTIAAQRATELAAEARTEPKDDFWERFGAFLEDVEAQSKQLKVPIPELADRIAARAAAQQSLAAAIGRQAEAAARVQESKKERAEKDGAHGEVQRVYQQAQAAHRAEVDKIRSQAPPQHADLGRQYIETPDAPQFTPAPPPLASARAALDRLTQTRSSIAQKRQRLAELEAS